MGMTDEKSIREDRSHRIERPGGAVVGTAGDTGIGNSDPVLAAVLAVATALYRLAVELRWLRPVLKVLK